MNNQEPDKFDFTPFIITGAIFFVIALVAVRFLLHLGWGASLLAAVAAAAVFAVVSYLTRPKQKPGQK